MQSHRWSIALVLLVACGPEAGVAPRTGVYEIATEVSFNDCEPSFGHTQEGMDGVRSTEEGLSIGHISYLSPAKPPHVPLAVWEHNQLTRDASGLYQMAPYERVVQGCKHRLSLEVELLATDVLRAHITDEWAPAGACTWVPARGCRLVRENTYTLLEACEGCTIAELRTRSQELWASEHPLP
jgi:hypothetical protein